MTTGIYTALQTGLAALQQSGQPIFRTVKMFWNEVEDEMEAENKIDAYLKPACLIQFTDIECNDLIGNKSSVQLCSYKIVLHLVWDIRIKDDLSILTAKQQCYAFMQTFDFVTNANTTGASRFLRRSEIINPEYKTLIYIQQIYTSTLKDFSAQQNTNYGSVATMPETINIIP